MLLHNKMMVMVSMIMIMMMMQGEPKEFVITKCGGQDKFDEAAAEGRVFECFDENNKPTGKICKDISHAISHAYLMRNSMLHIICNIIWYIMCRIVM